MRACWLKWVGRDWSISADYIWLNYSDANNAMHRTLNIILNITIASYCRAEFVLDFFKQ